MDYLPGPGFRLILRNEEALSGCKGEAEIAVEIRAEQSSLRVDLVQIVVEVSAIRGGFPNTWPTEPVFGWRCRSVLGEYEKGLAIRTAGYKLCILETMTCSSRS